MIVDQSLVFQHVLDIAYLTGGDFSPDSTECGIEFLKSGGMQTQEFDCQRATVGFDIGFFTQ